MTKSSTPKRFIAGAVCPSCAQMDKLVLWYEDGIKFHECVRCGYKKSELDARAPTEQERAAAKQAPQMIQWFKPGDES